MTKNIILHVGIAPTSVVENFQQFKQKQAKRGKKYRFFLLHSNRTLTDPQKEAYTFFDKVLKCNFNSPKSIIEALLPYEKEFLAATCRAESQILNFAKVVPHISYLEVPTSESLEWSVNKLLMRQRFKAYDNSITPAYSVVDDASKASIEKIEKKVGYPLVIKPAGLAQSLLVTIAYHREELEKGLNRVFKQLNRAYRDTKKMGDPKVLVEQFLDGTQYSIDAYVDGDGTVYCCPPVHIKTGKEIGFDDFFGYRQLTPTQLSKDSISSAETVTRKAIHALGLRSSTAHVELMKTEAGWKVIELGPRVGGFRNVMYDLSYGIDHTANDILIRIPKKPKVPKRIKGYTAAMKVFAPKEGVIKAVKGIKKIQDLESFQNFEGKVKNVGERAKFAKHGGHSVFNVLLFNKDRSRLLADIRRLEKLVKIEVE